MIMFYRRILKRVLDFTISLLLLVVSSPLLLVIMLFLLIANSGKPFFIQERPGKHGKVFQLIKLRTMRDDRDDQGKLLPDDLRITPLGRFIRFLSIDELPQVINVLKGDMSFVGPRPLLVRYLSLYNETQARRHNVRPGITGMAQVNGRNILSWEDRFEYDVYYVDHLSFGLDLKIIGATFRSVIRREGIYPDSGSPMGPFMGNQSN